ncbi:MAG: cytochrome c [Acidobacteria bacterium]|nr:cytochrome c [Acidobacteriota bacterium]MBV9147738.1 cytochrome c [Acidobacteriota bacterium]MBV9435816.1 cytochrome c [Acidobacteriota bacterium]
MRPFLFGVIIGVLIVPAVVYGYFRFGYAPVATGAPAMPFEKKFARMGLHARMDKEYPRTPAIQATPENYTAGAHVYREHCAVCHGVAGQPATSVAKGMYPRPPQLLQPDHGVTDDPAGETYWKVSNGIRMTGMPSFHQSLSDTQMWQVSLLLADADKLPAGVKSLISQPLPTDQPAAGSSGSTH